MAIGGVSGRDAAGFEFHHLRVFGFRTEGRDDGMQRPHPVERAGLRRLRAPAHGFRPGEIAHDVGDDLGDDLDGRAARLLHDGNIEVALLGVLLDFRFIDGFQPGALEEARDRAFRRADARAFLFLAHIRLPGRNAVHGEREPARRGEGFGALIDKPRLDQTVGDELPQILRGARLHARGDFFGEKFEQKIGHRYTAPPACVASQAAPQAFASSRTRKM